MEVGGFTLQQAEIGTESIQSVLQLDNTELGICLLAFKLLEFVECGGEFLLFGFDAFGKAGVDIACLLHNLLHAHNFLAQNSILLMSKTELLRVIGLWVTAAQQNRAPRAGT